MRTKNLNKIIKGLTRVTLIFILIAILGIHAKSQPINVHSEREGKQHVLTAGVGLEFTTNYSLQYAYRLKNAYVLTQFKLPFGSDVFDDWSWKTAFQYEVWHNNLLSFKVEPALHLNQFESEIAKLTNISASASTYFGIEQRKWGIGIMLLFNQNLRNNIENKAIKDYYPGVRDGWYGASGGYYKLGFTTNYNFDDWSIGCNIGEIFARNFIDNPTVPYYSTFTISKTF